MTVQNRASSKHAAVRAVVEDWAEALRAKDAGRVTSHFAEDNVQFTMAPPLQFSGATAIGKAELEAWFATFRGPIGYQVRDLKITASDDTAFCHFLNCLSATASDGGEFAMWNRVTLGLSKIDGKWRIAHLHQSVPFYMDGSFRAAADLEP
jgi:PhnB protein